MNGVERVIGHEAKAEESQIGNIANKFASAYDFSKGGFDTKATMKWR